MLKQKADRDSSLRLGYYNKKDNPGVLYIVVPVFNAQHHVFAALSVSGVTFQIPDEKSESLAQLIIEVGRKLS
ncbi:MAG: IclR family transcriptional regulator domain-containing protein [Candidatus Malihini olakiniferum]